MVSDKWDISRQKDQSVQIKDELMQLFNLQAEFFRKGSRSQHTKTEIAEYEKRRERARSLFAELDRLRKAA
jgi:uncharacterized protein YdcH (DUF465 family)